MKGLEKLIPKIEKSGEKVLVTIEVELSGSMLDMEDKIQDALNKAGTALTGEALARFDTGGEALKFGDVKFTSQQKSEKKYETPYGPVSIQRHVYQTSKGGKTYCPLDSRACIITSSTPRFAKIVSSKYVNHGASAVQADLETSNGRKVSQSYIQNLSQTVGEFSKAVEETLDYEIPEQKEEVTSISLSLDGTCMYMKDDGYREAMAGTISLYDAAGERLHTVYIGAAPEYGKELFLGKLKREIEKIKVKYPKAIYVGIADGAKCNWKFLEEHTSISILDFYHATEYLSGASEAFESDPGRRKLWLETACHNLKHNEGGAKTLLEEMEKRIKILPFHEKNMKPIQEKLEAAITYFTNQLGRMNYKEYQEKKLPIGSGVTEAACKTLIKQRLCNSGMKWKNTGAQIVISLRSMALTDGRWSQFWDKINRQGLSGILLP